MNDLVIVDYPDTPHGERMAECAELLGQLHITWVIPTDDLATELDALENVDAAAILFSIQREPGGGEIVDSISGAIERLMIRQIPVFVAAGNRSRNPLATAGIAVDSNFSVNGIETPAQVRTNSYA